MAAAEGGCNRSRPGEGGARAVRPRFGVRAPVAARARGRVAVAGEGRCPGRGDFGAAAGAEQERLGVDAHPGPARAPSAAGLLQERGGPGLPPQLRVWEAWLDPRSALPS